MLTISYVKIRISDWLVALLPANHKPGLNILVDEHGFSFPVIQDLEATASYDVNWGHSITTRTLETRGFMSFWLPH